MKRAFLIITITVSTYMYAWAQVFDVDTIQYNGDADKFFNLVILSDGYTSSELNNFVRDAQYFSNDFFAVVPFSHYQSYFNVFAIKVPSNESGASHPGTALDITEPVFPVETVDNFFGSAFDQYGIHRLLVATENAKIVSVLADNFPMYDQAIILVNSSEYGGSGGEFPTASLNEFSSDIALHELAHSIAGLKDEYYPGDIYAGEGINMTQNTNPTTVRWKNWYGIDSIAIYQHTGGGNAGSWYKPGNHCKMEIVDSAFCHVCVEGIIERIHSLINPLIRYEPTLNLPNAAVPLFFSLELMHPSPGTLKRQWTLNGTDFTSNVDSILIQGSTLQTGTNTLSVTIEDTTALLKVDNHQSVHLQSVMWTIIYNPVGIDVKSAVNTIEFSMFPNPASTEITVQLETTLQEKLRVELFNEAGERVRSTYVKDKTSTIHVGDLPPGIFIVRLLAGKQIVLSKQIIKL